MPQDLPDAAKYGTSQGLIQQIRHNHTLPVIFTEGDSWFSFPLHSNTIDHLRRLGRFNVLRLEKIGPWMDKAMTGRYDPAITVPPQNRAGVARWLVDELNTTLASINRKGFIHVKIPGTLSANQWNVEIHPKSMGFKAIARVFETALRDQFPDHF